MRKKGIFLIILFLASFLSAYAQAKPDEKLFQEAKILIFDEKWEEAQEKLEELIDRYPGSRWYSQALFYRARCLFEQKRRDVEAMKAYKDYLQLKEKNKSLAEEAERSIIDLAFRLYDKGRNSYLKEIEERLSSPNEVIKYYAAFQLSYVKEKHIASRAIPVLREVVEKVADAELRDRAKIALLRIDPESLKNIEDKVDKKARILKIRVYSDEGRTLDLSVNIPWALADLALSAIPESEKTIMRKEGYDLERVIEELRKMTGEIIEIVAEGKVIKIWIE